MWKKGTERDKENMWGGYPLPKRYKTSVYMCMWKTGGRKTLAYVQAGIGEKDFHAMPRIHVNFSLQASLIQRNTKTPHSSDKTSQDKHA